MSQTTFLPLLERRRDVLDEIEQVSAKIDKADDRGLDAYDLRQELDGLQRELQTLCI